jgi:hypothetical protein
MVMVLAAQDAETPGGRPEGAPIPVAADVVWVMAVKGVFTHKIGVSEAGPADAPGATVTVTDDVGALHAPWLAVSV